MKSEPDLNFEPWNRLIAAFRMLFPSEKADDTQAPVGFSTRVVAQWQEWRKNELFRAWERTSIRTAIACSTCAVAFGLFSFVKEQSERRQELLVVPPLEESANGDFSE
tara:strand:+ start:19803 stop:20126 length:324 start_codon:yes stop_codon:yes gene_type:complete